MILYKARPVTSKQALYKAVNENPAMVEIETPAGFSPSYAGTLANLPSGLTYFAKEGKVAATFKRIGARLLVE